VQWESMSSGEKVVEGQGATDQQVEVIDMDLSDRAELVHKSMTCLEEPGVETL
jgi:hypothetical protein